LGKLGGIGPTVTALGDLDGDGITDLATGDNRADDGGTDRGAALIPFLNADGTVKSQQRISSTHGGFTGRLSNGDGFAIEVAFLGDFDGDGVHDMAASARYDDDGGKDHGAVWILFLDGAFCSDAVVNDGEQCDDGNIADGDGCSRTCQIEGEGS
jgi:cysteine-rich repeat protein